MSKKGLIVPTNITVRTEFWQGYGKPEAVMTVIASLVLGLLAIGNYYLFHVGYVSMLAFLISVSTVIMLITKVQNGLSITDHIRIWHKYKKTQQKFMFVYKEGGKYGKG